MEGAKKANQRKGFVSAKRNGIGLALRGADATGIVECPVSRQYPINR